MTANRNYGNDQSMSAGEAETRRTEQPTATGAQPSSDGLVAWAREHWGKLDENKDGKVTKQEIEMAMQDKGIATANGAVYLSAMHDQIGQWNIAFETKSPDISDNYTQDGFKKFEAAKKDPNLLKDNAEKLDLLSIVPDFSRVDRNHDGRMDMSELDRALKREGFTDWQRHNFELAKKYYDRLLESSTDGEDRSNLRVEEQEKRQREGISQEDLQALPDQKAKEVVWMQNSINYFSRRLEELHKNPDQIVSQGLNNGCFFIAPAMQLQMRDPEAIKKMIKDNDDGTRTVTFPGAKDKPITVVAPTEAEMTTYANNRDVATLEKAFGINWWEKKAAEVDESNPNPPVKWAAPAERLQFGYSSYSLQMLTGRDSVVIAPSAKSEEELVKFLEDVHDKHKPLLVGSLDNRNNEAFGVTPRHALAAEYDPKTKMLTLTNPLWLGGGTREPTHLDRTTLDGKDDRTFQISIQQLRDKFFEVVTTND
jgi:hypothetical protein